MHVLTESRQQFTEALKNIEFHSTHWGDIAITLCYSARPPYPPGVHPPPKTKNNSYDATTDVTNFSQWKQTATKLRAVLEQVLNALAMV